MPTKPAILVALLGAVAGTVWLASSRAIIPTPLDFQSVVIPVGKGPGPITIADINHDGKPDIFLANT